MNFNNFSGNGKLGSTSRFKSFGLFIAMFWAFFFAMALSNVLSPYFSQVVNGLLSGITPLLLGMIVAFIFYRLIDFTEKVVLKNAFVNSPYKFTIKRSISILIVVLIIVGIIVLVFSILVPKIIDIIQRLTAGDGDGGTQIYNTVVDEVSNLLQTWFGADVSQESIQGVLNYVFEQFMQAVGYLDNVLELSINVVSSLFNVFMGMVLAIFMLKDKERISRFSRRFTYANFKKEKADEICVLTNNANKILYNYLLCKLIEFALIFVSLGVTFMILGLEFTWELALIIGLFNFIPYFGIYIGTLPAVLITMIFDSINAALYMTIATIIVTTLEFNIIVPLITSKRLKVSALLVATSIIVGGAMFGIAGMFFAPPIIAILSAITMGNIEMKENRMKYILELNQSREKNILAEQEQLGIVEKSIASTSIKSLENNKLKKDKTSSMVIKKEKDKQNAVNKSQSTIKTQIDKKPVKKNSKNVTKK